LACVGLIQVSDPMLSKALQAGEFPEKANSTRLLLLLGIAAICLFVCVDGPIPLVAYYAAVYLLLGSLTTGFHWMDVWCQLHAMLDFVMHDWDASVKQPPLLYIPLHTINHASMIYCLRNFFCKRHHGKQRFASTLMAVHILAIIITSLREMQLIAWTQPVVPWIGVDLPPLDDLAGLVAVLILVFGSCPQYGALIFVLHVFNNVYFGPCGKDIVQCRKGVFNNFVWHWSTLLFRQQLASLGARPWILPPVQKWRSVFPSSITVDRTPFLTPAKGASGFADSYR